MEKSVRVRLAETHHAPLQGLPRLEPGICARWGQAVCSRGRGDAYSPTEEDSLTPEPEQLRAVPEKVGIAKQVEGGELQLIAAQPRREGDVGPDTRGFA